MDFGLNYGWVCPVCGKANAPWASQCTCEGKPAAPYEPTCNMGTTGALSTLHTSQTHEDFQKAAQDYFNLSDNYSSWLINSYGDISKVDDGPSDSTANN